MPASINRHGSNFPMRILSFFIIVGLFMTSCSSRVENVPKAVSPKGSLLIIGGGKRGPVLIDRLIDEGKLKNGGYIFILPMASELPDSAIIWSAEPFIEAGITNITGYNFSSLETMTGQMIDSLKAASVIYIAGGDQNRFMDMVRNTPLDTALHDAYMSGCIIAGSSAGAAVMSHKMITGNELRHPDYNSTFQHLEKDNIELDSGMGFINSAVVDQHFIKRSRYNRLISIVSEHPDLDGIGIDEATAILVKQDSAEVIGESQVVVFRNVGKTSHNEQGKLGLDDLRMMIYLPGKKFQIGSGH